MGPQTLGLPEDFDGDVRLFPLPNLVVFPGNVQPLRIFESRYCDMLERALESDQLITMATLESSYEQEYHECPPIAPVVCIGRVIAHHSNDDATHDLLLAGIARAHIEAELPQIHAFREATVTVLEDSTPHESSTVIELRDSLLRELHHLIKGTALDGNVLPENLPLNQVTDFLAFHLPLRLSLKLRLLAETDVLRRANIIAETLMHDDNDEFGDKLPKFSLN